MEPPRNLREYSKESLASEVERLRTKLGLAESIIRKQECFIKKYGREYPRGECTDEEKV